MRGLGLLLGRRGSNVFECVSATEMWPTFLSGSMGGRYTMGLIASFQL